MKRLLTSLAAGTAVAALATGAIAADLPVYQAEPAYVAPVQPVAYDWTGLYVGVQGGYAFGDSDNGVSPEGALVGGTVGYNHQFGQFVAGIEADLSYSDIEDTYNFDTVAGPASSSLELDYLATVRGRLGYAWDRTLIYATGGVAFGDVTVDVSNPAGDNSEEDTAVGYVLGAGVEYAFTDNWTVKGEYNYVDLGDIDTPPGRDDQSFDAHIVKAGLNYKF